MTTAFSSVLKDILAEQGMKQARVVEMADIDHAYLSRLLSGQRSPTRDIVVRIVTGCEFSPEDSLRLYVAAGFVPDGSGAALLDPELVEAADTLNDPTIPQRDRDSLRLQISALVGIARQMAA